MNHCWILTRCINADGQNGEYFVAVFRKKPTKEELTKYLEEVEGYKDKSETISFEQPLKKVVRRLLSKGGGRIGTEFCWYYLKKVAFS